MRTLSLAIVLLFADSVAAMSQSAQEVFQQANEAYRAGKFADAIASYESILNQGLASAELYYNLGNAYYRSNATSKAILSYERALRLQPGDGDIRTNLALTNLRVADHIEPVPELFVYQWTRAAASWMSVRSATMLVVFGWALLFCSLATMFVVIRVEVIRWLRWSALAGGVCLIAFGLVLGAQMWVRSAGEYAIVTGPVVTAKSSPDDQSVDAFVIHEGLKVRVSDQLSDWSKIILADGKVGWIKSSQCEQI